MTTKIARVFLLALLLSTSALSLIGCTNTVRGVGKDTEKVGEHMEDYNHK